MKAVLSAFLLVLCVCFTGVKESHAQKSKLPTIESFTRDMKAYSGYFEFYWDEQTGKIWMTVNKWDKEFLYMDALAAGIGSNDIGMDRSQLGDEHVVRFEKVGPKILLVQENLDYRATTTNPAERKSVHDAFASSVLYGFKAEAQTGNKVLVDITDFLMQDVHHVARSIKQTDQGNYRVDPSRSAVYLQNTKNFPENTELEVTLTLKGSHAGRWLRSVTPDPDFVTVRVHHSFIKLPDDGYKTREYDPRCGYFDISYKDYATPITKPLVKRFIIRHNLIKKHPDQAVSEPVKPIIYYVDSGVPEPVRSALIGGASWWNKAFEAAGFKNAFQVKVLPDSVDPLDIRYNVINWVHRSTRGWSYGSSVVDPRTGEIIKANVLLGSLRVRQDYLIAQGLLSPFKDGVPSDTTNPMLKMALARIRQLAAHETGHTLGLAHNFASSYNNRASVMDYPQPLVKLNNKGQIDLSDAYGVGVGDWDVQAIKYGYTQFPSNIDKHQALQNILNNDIKKGLLYISDYDARPEGAAHPYAHLWDNNKSPYKELDRMLTVRKKALEQFSENTIPQGTPMATLQDVLVPIYLYHRYQVKATATMVGGLDYSYKLRGDGQPNTSIVAPNEQRQALKSLMNTLSPDVLALPESLLNKIAPRPPDYYDQRELFKSHTGVTFDPLAAAETASRLTIHLLLNPERDARLIEYHARNKKNPGLTEVIDHLLGATWKMNMQEGYTGAIQRTVDDVALDELIQLLNNKDATEQVRSVIDYQLNRLDQWLKDPQMRNVIRSEAWQAHFDYAIQRLQHRFQDEHNIPASEPSPIPPGDPIGDGGR